MFGHLCIAALSAADKKCVQSIEQIKLNQCMIMPNRGCFCRRNCSMHSAQLCFVLRGVHLKRQQLAQKWQSERQTVIVDFNRNQTDDFCMCVSGCNNRSFQMNRNQSTAKRL